MRLAAIDVGTNTVLLLVADVIGDTLRVVADQERFARLGQDVDATGRLAPEAMDRVVARLRECRAVARELGAERIVLGATSASRDASNTDELVQRVRRELGIDYRVIDGDEEAALSFRGAMAMLRPVPAEAVVVDVGGGSTEVVGGAAGSRQPSRVSLDVGSVRLTERHLRRLPAAADAVAAAMADAAGALSRVPDDLAALRPVVAAAGTARVAAGLAGAAAGRVATADVLAWRDRLLRQSARETLTLDPALMSGRADVAAAGLLVLGAALERFGATEFLATAGGLRHGLALQAAAGE
jgi:exopolyphosphatase/guanosine-5'-triphosphate,3'-diphosphate pyrophosphatase